MDAFYQPQGTFDPALSEVLNGQHATPHRDSTPTQDLSHTHPSDNPLGVNRLASPKLVEMLNKQAAGEEAPPPPSRRP